MLVVIINTAMGYSSPFALCPLGKLVAAIGFTDAGARLCLEDYFYFFGDAVCWFLVGWYCYLVSTGIARIVCFVFFGLTVSNLLDELLFNPYEVGYNESGLTIVIVAIAIYKFSRLRNNEIS